MRQVCFRTIQILSGYGQTDEQARDVVSLVEQGYKVESAVGMNSAIYYILVRDVPAEPSEQTPNGCGNTKLEMEAN